MHRRRDHLGRFLPKFNQEYPFQPNPKEENVKDQAMEVDEEESECSKEIEIRNINNLLLHKIYALKLVSQNVHSDYIVL